MNTIRSKSLVVAAIAAAALVTGAGRADASPLSPIGLQQYAMSHYGISQAEALSNTVRGQLQLGVPQAKCTDAGTPYLQAQAPAMLHCP